MSEKSNTGKPQAKANAKVAGTQRIFDYIQDQFDQYNIDNQFNLETLLGQDQYANYLENETLLRGQAVDVFDKQYEGYLAGIDYIDRAAQTAFEQEFLGFQQDLYGIETDFNNLQRQNSRDQLQAAYATGNLNLQLDNLGLSIGNQRLSNQNVQFDIDNNRLSNANLGYDIRSQNLANRSIGIDISNNRLSNQNIRNQLANQRLALDSNNLQIQNNKLQQDSLNNNILSAKYDANIIQNSILNNVIDGEEIQRQVQRLKIEENNRRDQFGVQMNEQSLQMQKQAADSRLSMLTESLKGQAAAGQASASGRRGNSAQAIINTATTLSSINSGAIVDNLMRGQESFANATQGLISQDEASRKIFDSNRETLRGQAQQNRNNRDTLETQLQQNELRIDNLRNDRQTVINNRGILRNQGKEIRNNMDSTRNNLEIGKNRTDQLEITKKQGELRINQLENNLEQGENRINQLQNNLEQGKNKVSQLKNDKQTVKNNINEVAAMLGITQEQFEADAATLSQMYMDKLPAFENVVERISNAVYRDKTNLFNKMPLPPKFAAMAESPYMPLKPELLPRTLLEPQTYDSDSWAIEQPSSGGGNSGIGALLGGLLAVGVTAATGGLAAPIATSLPIATGAWGMGSQAGNLLEGVFNY